MVEKAASCAECPRMVSGNRCRASRAARQNQTSDILWIYTQPESIDITMSEPGIAGPTYSVMQTALGHLYKHHPEWRQYSIRKTYAAQCVPQIEDDKPRARVLEACAPLVRDVIRETCPQLIVSFGATALKQLGRNDKFTDVRGRVLEPEETGLPAPLLVTFSEKAVTGAPGLFETYLQDLRNGYARLERGKGLDVSLDQLTQNYVLPSTMDTALELVRMLIALPDNTALAVDTETTSLRPEKDGTRVIAFCFAWGAGKATTILYDHPFAPPEYLARLPELEAAIRELLLTPKPKVFHNAKFDLKWIELKLGMPVANVVWCTLVGEHFLDEDKKGNYGLKALTTVWLPAYCGYEDKLHDILEATDVDALAVIDEKIDALSTDYAEYAGALEGFKGELSAYQAAKAAWDVIHAEYQAALTDYNHRLLAYKEALAAWETLPKRPARPTKPSKLAAGASTEAQLAHLQEVARYDHDLAAYGSWSAPPKPVKDFTRPSLPARLEKPPKEPKDPRTKKEKAYTTDAGFEKVPVHELQLYGGVDGDVTRRLSSLQLQRLTLEAKAQGNELSACRTLMHSHGIPASRVLGEMEYYGTRIDQNYIQVLEAGFTKVIDATGAELARLAPGINMNSGPALAKLLYDDGWTHPDGTHIPPVPCILLTKKLARSTAAAALAPYLQYEEVETAGGKKEKVPKKESLLLDTHFRHKKALKGRDTFLTNFRVLSKRDGKMHTSFHINGTGTGRLSCVRGDTPIRTSVGLVPIRDVTTAHQVMSHTGTYRKVLATHIKGTETMYRVQLSTGEVIHATEDHRMLTPRGWRTVGELRSTNAIDLICVSLPRRKDVFATVLSIEPAGEALVYDITVEEDHSYASVDVYHHNSSDMNLQNTPKFLAGLNLKKLFIPDDPATMVFVNSDYKGAEVRVFTAYAPDPGLIKALNDGMDMHSFFASQVFGKPYADYEQRDRPPPHWAPGYEKLLNTERTQIKRVVFGILYGAGPTKIAEQIGVSMEKGKELIELLFTMFPAIRDYIDEIKYLVARDGYVETLFGRRRRFPLQATSRHRSRAERQACNFKIQSTSSDIVIGQLIEMHEVIHSDTTWPEWGIHKPLHTYGARVLLTVHDSICLQWPKALIRALEPWLTYYGETRVREKYPWLPVPFKMDIEVGPSYGEVMPVHKYIAGMPPLVVVDDALITEEEVLNELRQDAFENG